MTNRNKKKSIVIVNQSAGYLMIDIIYALLSQYDEIILMAGNVAPRNRPLPESVKLISLSPYDRTSGFKRISTWSMAFLKSLWLIFSRYRKSDLFLVSNPPVSVFIPLIVQNSCRFLIYDVYPDALIEYKYFKKGSFIDKIWSAVNKRVFSKASVIYTISEGMRTRLSQYVMGEKIKVVPVWTDNDFLKPIPKNENSFREELGINNQFLVMYSGNLGRSHDIEALVELAKATQDHPIYYLIIGGGDKYKKIEESILQSGLSNIRIMPWQPVELLPLTMAAADLAVVSLGKEASLLSVPSKTFNFMSVGAPLLCIASPESELSLLVDKYDMGKCFDSEDLEKMKAYILMLHDNPTIHKQMSENALKATSDFTPENAKLFV